ncbi:LysR family transcriptional regulator [Zhongshania marina]|uniref:LysR family transcriptional regulator n=1 Tax=Zhongshania marina TaxID=2304603 RepID=A0A2S4HKW6_9GAMM|nr:LysR family transcriptional regulator [Marortus luteolus]
MELRHLRYFIAVAEEASFRRAALKIHVSQPPLTRQIKQLEDIVGTDLFLRTPKGVELTEAGKSLFIDSKNIFTLIQQAAERANSAGAGKLGKLNVGIFGSAVFGTIPIVIQKFREDFPDVEIVLHNLNRVEQLKALRDGRIAIGFNRFFREEPDLAWEKIQSEKMSVALHSSSMLATKKSLKLSEIINYPIILYPKTARPSFIDRMISLFNEQKLSPNIAHEVDDVVTAVALVSSGLGISLVTESACNLKLPNVEYIPLSPSEGAVFDLNIIYRRNDISPILQAFISTVNAVKKSL